MIALSFSTRAMACRALMYVGGVLHERVVVLPLSGLSGRF